MIFRTQTAKRASTIPVGAFFIYSLRIREEPTILPVAASFPLLGGFGSCTLQKRALQGAHETSAEAMIGLRASYLLGNRQLARKGVWGYRSFSHMALDMWRDAGKEG